MPLGGLKGLFLKLLRPVLVNQHTVRSGGVSKGKVTGRRL